MKFAAVGAALSASTAISPAAAQFPVYGYSYGGSGYPYAYGGNRQIAVNRCSETVQARLSGNGYGYGYGGAYGYGGRVLGISRVEPNGYGGGVTVHGVASSGRYSGDGYGDESQMPVDLTWRCTADYRGFVVGVSITPAQRTYGGSYGYQPIPYDGYDLSQYGYRRY
ncbi:MAG TPA: hypothetical protein VJ846_10990 [Sphingomicrobium sp.]|nr:hypothetical protein [Sphingomicrobium sp.]